MDYEEKYKEALDRARTWKDKSGMPKDKQGILDDIFPELKENEDELKWLTKFIEEEAYYLSMDIRGEEDRIKFKNLQKSLAWLEKQGEQKPQCKSAVETINEVEGGNRYGVNDTPYNYEHAIMAQKDFSVKQEPKFNVGDWVVDNCGYVWKIEGILNKFYLLEDVDGGESCSTIEWVNKTFHLWTIRDAKEGDVIVTKNKNIFIFKSISDCTVYDYCGLYFGKFTEDSSSVNGHLAVRLPIDYVPANKEQRDLLFQKMKEAGYEWDAI